MRNITHNPTAQRFEYTEHSETYYVSYRAFHPEFADLEA